MNLLPQTAIMRLLGCLDTTILGFLLLKKYSPPQVSSNKWFKTMSRFRFALILQRLN